ncbi:MAG TPA: beta-ketoacyl synthase N-terminal-like domain-containing protein [Gammaproteobacteria bacterium]|nr:beta-ketoacyl synthase N-terminal-like domain-containing protein [Gammaproteobacteria bacterium]
MPNIVSLLIKRSALNPGNAAYLFLGKHTEITAQLTNAELDTKARRLAAYLLSRNLGGERVLLIYPPGLDFIVGFLGCLYAGVIAVPVQCPPVNEFEKSKSLLQTIALDADIKGIFTTHAYLGVVNQAFSALTLREKPFIEDTTLISVITVPATTLPFIDDKTIAYLQYTSGSTSTPKAAVVRHANLMHSLRYTAKAWHYTNDSITLNWAPHTHVYGLVCGILVPLYQGSLGILMPTKAFVERPLTWLEAITQHQVTHSGCPNFGYHLCAQDIKETEKTHLNLQSWQVAINGGENVQHDTLVKFSKQFSACGFRPSTFCSAYGMSELTGAISVTRYGEEPPYVALDAEKIKMNVAALTEAKITDQPRYVSSGTLIEGLSVRIVDPNTLQPLSRGKIGEVWLAGASVVEGYWRRPEETRAVFNATLPDTDHLFFRTGDLGFLNESALFLTGRLKEIIVLNGKKYYPLDLEKSVAIALANMPVNNIRVAFSTRIENKEAVMLVQELTDTNISESIQNEINEKIRRIIAQKHGLPLHSVILTSQNTIPRTASGKLQRKLCEKKIAEGSLPIIKQYTKSTMPYMKGDIIRADYIKHVAEALDINVNDIDLTAPISQYDFDSISITKLSTLLNDAYHLNVMPASLYEYTTLGEFFNDIVGDAPQAPDNNTLANTPINADIAIIGMSGVFPGADNVETLWNNLYSGKNAITEIPTERWDWKAYETIVKWGGFINGVGHFDAGFFNISRREAELMDPQQRLFLQTVWKTIEDAGYSTTAIANAKVGLYVGVFNNDYAELLQKQDINDAYLTTGITRSLIANRVSYLLNFQGPSEAIDTACSSSLVAIHHAVRAIQSGDCEVAIAGGVNLLLTPTAYISATKAGMLSVDGQCKTFSKNANGYVRAEGAAAILLKPLTKALADNDHIYGVIKGCATNHGGHVSSLSAPNPIAQAEVIVAACRQANISINDMQYIETHGTGTALGDPIEINGLKKAFSILSQEQHNKTTATPYCGLGSIKSNIGHLEPAAGIAGIIKVLLAMQHGKLPGNLHCEELNPHITLTDSSFFIVDKAMPWPRLKNQAGHEQRRLAGVSSFGFGGTNAHVILEEAPIHSPLPVTHVVQKPYLISLSAKTAKALMARIQDLHNWLLQQTSPSIAAISYTLNTGRNHFDKRCILVVNSTETLQKTLRAIQQNTVVDNAIINMHNNGKLQNQDAFAPLLRQLYDEINDGLTGENDQGKLLALGNLYTQGYDLDWNRLYTASEKIRISLPTYPFEKDYYWLAQTPAHHPIQQATAEEEAPLLQRIQQDLYRQMSLILKIDTASIEAHTAFSDYGFDSISFKEFSLALEEHYNIALPPTVFFSYNNVDALSNYLLDNLNQATPTAIQSEIKPVKSHKTDKAEPIAIIGMHGMFPQSEDHHIFWQHLLAGNDLISEVPGERWNWRDYYSDTKQDKKTNSKWGGFLPTVDTFDASFFNMSSREANLMDPQQRLFLEIAWKTIEDAGYNPLALSGHNVGVFAGVEFSEYQKLIESKGKTFHGHVATGNSHTMIANRVSYFFDFHGPSEIVATACSSSLVAIHRAVRAIQNGECTTALAGGVSLILDPDTFVTTTQLGALSPDGRCKTFDKSANGYVKGEGVAAILLKPLNQAQADGDHIYGMIKGTAANHGGRAQSLTAPNAAAQSELIVSAIKQAGIDPETITYIETHGTGTELGDPIEIEGLKQAFSTLAKSLNKPALKKAYCGLGSVKTNAGHLEPASGMAGVFKVLLSMQHRTIPANLHFKDLNPYIKIEDSPFYIIDKNQEWKRLHDTDGNEIARRAGVSSFGFGGSNSHIVIEEAPPTLAKEPTKRKQAYLIILSAKKLESLRKKASDLLAWIHNHQSTVDLAELSYTLQVGRAHFDKRIEFIVASIAELTKALGTFLASEDGIINAGIDHSHYYIHDRLQRVAGLPSYPFIRQRYWFNAEQKNSHAVSLLSAKASSDLHAFTLKYLQRIFAEKLALSPDDITVNSEYETFGFDSLIGFEIGARLVQDFGELRRTLFYEKTTLQELSAYLEEEFRPVLEKLYSNAHATATNPWIAYRKIQKKAKMRLFCFPYAGSGASVYSQWQKELPDDIEVCPVQLPGRENRLNESFSGEMDHLLDALMKNLQHEFDLPFAFFGHSFGSLVAFELARRLQKEQSSKLIHLFASAHPDPSISQEKMEKLLYRFHAVGLNLFDFNQNAAMAHLNDAQLNSITTIFSETGMFTYHSQVTNREIIKATIPIFLGDMGIMKKYQYREQAPLDIPITVFSGTRDIWSPPEEHVGWSMHTKHSCDIYQIDSGHLFIGDKLHKKIVLAHITKMLQRHIN